MGSAERLEFWAVCEYPSSRLELAEVLRLLVAAAAALRRAAVLLPAWALALTTRVLQLLLHCEPSLVVLESTSPRRAGRSGGGGIGDSEPSPAGVGIAPLLTSSPEPEAGQASGSSSLCTRSLTMPDVVLEEVLEMSEMRWSAREPRAVRLSLHRAGYM